MGKGPRRIKCPECGYYVAQVIDRIISGKRVVRCFSCARAAGWFMDSNKEPEQLKLIDDEYWLSNETAWELDGYTEE
jgi:endogenous inhibitor of DNA gyrase (YacG/DUF329 family)